MTIESLIGKASEIDTWILVVAFLTPPALVWIFGRLHRGQNEFNAKRNTVYSFFVYLVCIPGMFSSVLTAYTMFFVRQNLLQVNFFIYFFPILSMIVTLVLVNKNVVWNDLPGVDRLYALMILIAVTFGIALAVYKSRIWIFFGGSIALLILFCIFLFALLKWGMTMLFRSKDEPRMNPPSFSKSRTWQKGKGPDPEKELKKMKRKMGIRDCR